MKLKAYLSLAILSASPVAFAAGLTFTDSNTKPVEIKPEASTGLQAVYVLENTQGVKAGYVASSADAAVAVSRFSNLGGGFAEPMFSERDGARVSFRLDANDMGYIVEENGRQTCFWVVNYANHEMQLSGLSLSAESDCMRAVLEPKGTADRITYYTINGRGVTLDRNLELTYNTLEFDEATFDYTSKTATEHFEYLEALMPVAAPLCSTDFVLTGDRFLSAWGREVSVTSPTMQPIAVEAHTSAEQAERDAENEIKDSNSGLGGSAPADITFKAAVTDAAIYREWQISRDPDFQTLENSFRDLEISYTFTDNGTTYVRFLAADNSGVCEFTGQTYEIFIGESKLTCPNAFSPGASPGVNDEWRVSYKSIVSYDCHIFSRWGKEVFSSTDPAEGWDGRVGGRLAPAGVYYYVIKAKGADGVDYKLSGDINIINFNAGTSGSGEPSSDTGGEP